MTSIDASDQQLRKTTAARKSSTKPNFFAKLFRSLMAPPKGVSEDEWQKTLDTW